jgi:hypothetical protein
MDVQECPKSQRKQGRKKVRNPAIKPAVPPEAKEKFKQLMDCLTSEDAELAARTMTRISAVALPELKMLIVREIVNRVKSRDKRMRDRASALCLVFAPGLILGT